MKFINSNLVESLIGQTHGKMFTVSFVKRDGSLRTINARTGVTKHLRGGVKTTGHIPELVTVFDMGKKAYRTINKTTVVEIKALGAKVSS